MSDEKIPDTTGAAVTEQTGKDAASKAGRLLGSKKSTADVKTVSASALAGRKVSGAKSSTKPKKKD